jgi:arylformamidase
MTRIIDLSHPIEHGQPVHPGDPPLEVRAFGTFAPRGYNLTQISIGSHHGTHLDAPFHFYEDGRTIDRIPLGKFYGPATWIDLAPGGFLPPKTPIMPEMLAAHEEKFAPGARVLYRTGWDRFYGTPEFFADFPSLTLEAARWIAARRIALLGTDAPGPSVDYAPVHHALLAPEAEIVIVEALANLALLPERFVLAAFPLNLKGRDGAPVRAVALVE